MAQRTLWSTTQGKNSLMTNRPKTLADNLPSRLIAGSRLPRPLSLNSSTAPIFCLLTSSIPAVTRGIQRPISKLSKTTPNHLYAWHCPKRGKPTLRDASPKLEGRTSPTPLNAFPDTTLPATLSPEIQSDSPVENC